MSRSTPHCCPSVAGRLLAMAMALAAGGAAAQPVPVRTVQPQTRDLELVSTQPATAEAYHEADLGAKVSGYVAELAVDIGANVVAGQPLATLAVPELEQARNAAAAEVEGLRSEHERIAILVERNSMTPRALTEATSRLDTARARLAEIDEEMKYATIEAPFDGVVTYRTIDPGDMVYEASSPKGGDQPLLRVAKLDVIRVKTFVPERESAWVDVGDPVVVTFDALPGQSFAAAVARVSGSLDPGTRTMLVEIDLDNGDRRIRPGYYGQTRIALEKRPGVLALPSESVRLDAEQPYVFVVGAQNAAQRLPVGIGIERGGWLEITGGVAPDARVIASPPAGLADGTPLILQ